MSHHTTDSAIRGHVDVADDMPGLIPAYQVPFESTLTVPQDLTPALVANPRAETAPGDSASTSNTATAPKRKRANGAGLTSSELADRRQQVESRIAALEAVLDAAETIPPTLTAPDPSTTSRPLRSAARDVWYFMTGADSKDIIPESEIDAQIVPIIDVGIPAGVSRLQRNTASQSQSRGYLRVLTHGQNLQRASSIASASESPSMPIPEATSSYSLPAITHGRLAPSPADIRAHNLGAVEFELNRYISAGTIPVEGMGGVALTEFWKANRFTYPLLYRIAMDVLPVQASSVSSERVFSSSKLTCTSERNRVSTRTMESFQVLKHSLYRRRRENVETQGLDFMAHEFENLELTD